MGLERRPDAAPLPLAWSGGRPDFDRMLDDWAWLSQALNELNRSMGLPDAYPFKPSGVALDKLRFIDQLIRAAAASGHPPSQSAAGP